MLIEVEMELVLTALVMIFALCIGYLWIKHGQSAAISGIHGERRTPARRHPIRSDLTGAADEESCSAKAALFALQKYTDAITNISAIQISPQLYSNYLINAETLSMITANTIPNKYQMLTVYDDLKSKVAVYSSGFDKFVDILRGYPEYEGLANDLEGTYHHWWTVRKLPIPKAETSSHNTNEGNAMPFTNNSCKASKEHVTLEAKLHVPPDQGHQCVKVIQRFTRHCSISHSSVSGMIMGEDCMTVNFQVPTSSLPDLEKKITDSRQSLSSMKVSLVKILGKTVFETDSGKKQKDTKLLSNIMVGYFPELEAIGSNTINCEHHGIVQIKISRSTAVFHDSMIYVGGGTTGKSKQNLCMVLVYNPNTQSTLSIVTKVKFFSLAVLNDKLTTVGGIDIDKMAPSNKIYSWDETTKQWNEYYPPMPTPRRSTTSIVYDTYLIVLGGIGALPSTVTIVEVLDIQNQKWYFGQSLPEKMYNVQAVVVENSLYLLGGNSTSVWYCSLPTLIMGAISAFYNLPQLWRRLSSLPYRCSAAALLGKHLLAIGGDDEAANMTDLIHSYSPDKGCWEKAGSLRTGRRNCAAVKILDETVLVIGGADSPSYDAYCENIEVVHLHIS